MSLRVNHVINRSCHLNKKLYNIKIITIYISKIILYGVRLIEFLKK